MAGNATQLISAWLALAAPPSAPELNGQENILAIHVTELTLEPNFQILRRPPLRVERVHRFAMGKSCPSRAANANRESGSARERFSGARGAVEKIKTVTAAIAGAADFC